MSSEPGRIPKSNSRPTTVVPPGSSPRQAAMALSSIADDDMSMIGRSGSGTQTPREKSSVKTQEKDLERSPPRQRHVIVVVSKLQMDKKQLPVGEIMIPIPTKASFEDLRTHLKAGIQLNGHVLFKNAPKTPEDAGITMVLEDVRSGRRYHGCVKAPITEATWNDIGPIILEKAFMEEILYVTVRDPRERSILKSPYQGPSGTVPSEPKVVRVLEPDKQDKKGSGFRIK